MLEKGVRDRIDVESYPQCEGGEILVIFPDPHVEITLNLEEAERMAIFVANGIQEVKRARYKEALREAEDKKD